MIPRIRETSRSLLTRPPQLCNYQDSTIPGGLLPAVVEYGLRFWIRWTPLPYIPVRLAHSPLDARVVLYLLRMVKRMWNCFILHAVFLCIIYLFCNKNRKWKLLIEIGRKLLDGKLVVYEICLCIFINLKNLILDCIEIVINIIISFEPWESWVFQKGKLHDQVALTRFVIR